MSRYPPGRSPARQPRIAALSPARSPGGTSGRGSAAIKAAGAGADSAALLRTLTGTLEFHVDNGALEGADLWYEIRRARAVLKQQPIPARTGPEPFWDALAAGEPVRYLRLG